jgi:hypothetical protein
VSGLIALGHAHPKQMDDVLFDAQRRLANGCYPSQGARLATALTALGG